MIVRFVGPSLARSHSATMRPPSAPAPPLGFQATTTFTVRGSELQSTQTTAFGATIVASVRDQLARASAEDRARSSFACLVSEQTALVVEKGSYHHLTTSSGAPNPLIVAAFKLALQDAACEGLVGTCTAALPGIDSGRRLASSMSTSTSVVLTREFDFAAIGLPSTLTAALATLRDGVAVLTSQTTALSATSIVTVRGDASWSPMVELVGGQGLRAALAQRSTPTLAIVEMVSVVNTPPIAPPAPPPVPPALPPPSPPAPPRYPIGPLPISLACAVILLGCVLFAVAFRERRVRRHMAKTWRAFRWAQSAQSSTSAEDSSQGSSRAARFLSVVPFPGPSTGAFGSTIGPDPANPVVVQSPTRMHKRCSAWGELPSTVIAMSSSSHVSRGARAHASSKAAPAPPVPEVQTSCSHLWAAGSATTKRVGASEDDLSLADYSTEGDAMIDACIDACTPTGAAVHGGGWPLPPSPQRIPLQTALRAADRLVDRHHDPLRSGSGSACSDADVSLKQASLAAAKERLRAHTQQQLRATCTSMVAAARLARASSSS